MKLKYGTANNSFRTHHKNNNLEQNASVSLKR